MKIVEFEGDHGRTVWVNPLFVTSMEPSSDLRQSYVDGEYKGMVPKRGTEIHFYGEKAWITTWVSAEPDEVARLLSEAMS